VRVNRRARVRRRFNSSARKCEEGVEKDD